MPSNTLPLERAAEARRGPHLRTRLAVVSLIVLAAGLAPLTSVGAAPVSDLEWTSLRGVPSGVGAKADNFPIKPSNVAGLSYLWSAQAPFGYCATTTPVVAQGIVFRNEPDSSLHAFVARTGTPLWTSPPLGALVCTSPTIGNDLVYSVSSQAATAVSAFEMSTGRLVWQIANPDQFQSGSPVFADGAIFIGSTYGIVYAFDAQTGQLRWSTSVGGLIASAPAVSNGLVVLDSNNSDGDIVALDEATGALRWRSRDIRAAVTSPAISDGLVFISSVTGTVRALRLSDGVEQWSAPVGLGEGYTPSSVAVSDGRVFVGGYQGVVVALDATTGALRWSVGGFGFVTCTPAVAAKVVYCGRSDTAGQAQVTALSWGDGHLLWQSPLGTGGLEPVVAEGQVFAVNNWSQLNVFGLTSPPCTRSVTGSISGPVVVGGGEHVCVRKARVSGAIVVDARGALTVRNSRILGGVSTDGAVFVRICGSRIAGGFGASGSGGPVVVGDATTGCAGNQVTSGMSVAGNLAGVTVGNNRSYGDVNVDHTAGSATITSNVVLGDLNCAGNAPDPTNAGRPNTVRGAKTGQCAAL